MLEQAKLNQGADIILTTFDNGIAPMCIHVKTPFVQNADDIVNVYDMWVKLI